jgi:hypothetical protein
MLLHVPDEPFDWSHPESKKSLRHEEILGKILFRHWKDHFKNDLRSDQDHRLKIDLRSMIYDL